MDDLKYALYLRKSSEEKTKQAMSIESQEEELQPLIHRTGLNVTAVFREAKSAKQPGRPLFNEMMKKMQRGECNAIVCWHINRLTRNEKDSGDLRWLLRSGIIKEIRTPEKTYYPDDNAFLLAVETASGEQFIQDLIRGSRRGTLTKLKMGGVPFKAPVGYKNDRLARTVIADAETFPIVRKAWEMFLSGFYSVSQIREEIPIRLTLARWYTLFASEFYTGKFEYMGDLYQGTYPPMITESEYQRAQNMLGKGVAPKKSKHQFAYSHLFVCEVCGSAMVADRKKKVLADGDVAFYTYYACAQGIKGKCTRKGVREERFGETTKAVLSEVTLDADFWELAKKVNRRYAEENTEVSNRIQGKQSDLLKELASERLEYVRLKARGKISEDIFDSETARIDKQIQAIRKNMSESQVTSDQEWEAVNDVFEFSSSMLQSFQEGDDRMKNWILRKFGGQHRVNEGVVYIEPNEMMVAVRTYIQSEKFQREKFELQKIGSHISEIADPMSLIPDWYRLVEAVRTIYANGCARSYACEVKTVNSR